MPLRPYKLPADLTQIAKIAAETWTYPDNPEWNVQPDEEESLEDSIENYQRIWPLIRLVQFLSPGLRDFIHGHVWEDNGQLAGFTQIHRRGTTASWTISAVGVRPNFRRQGIAKKLVQAEIDFVRARGGKHITLDVIDGNVPAINLYTKLDFENFSTNIETYLEPETRPEALPIPQGYTLESVDDYAWQPRYELMRRITPPTVTQFETVEVGRYKRPFFMRLLFPIIKRAEGLNVHRFIIRDATEQVVAYAVYDTRTRETGRNTINAHLDPAHAALAPFLVNYILNQIIAVNPNRMIEFGIPRWQEPLLTAARNVGFKVRVELLTMGIALN